MKIINCNIQGQKHRFNNAPCEDGYYILAENNVIAAAIADGAGSYKYPYAKNGADTVSRAVCEFFTEKFDSFFELKNEYEMREILSAVCTNALYVTAKELELDSITKMASTLAAVAFKDDKAIACQVGDSLLGIKKGGFLEPVFLPQYGEFIGTTFFISDEKSYQMIQVRKFFLTSVSHIFLMTDGISEYVYDEFTGQIKNAMGSLLEFLNDENGSNKLTTCISENIVDADRSSDDCTMIIIGLRNEAYDHSIDTPLAPATENVIQDCDNEAIIENENHSLSNNDTINSEHSQPTKEDDNLKDDYINKRGNDGRPHRLFGRFYTK